MNLEQYKQTWVRIISSEYDYIDEGKTYYVEDVDESDGSLYLQTEEEKERGDSDGNWFYLNEDNQIEGSDDLNFTFL